MEIRYEFRLHGAVQRSGTVELTNSDDRLCADVAPPPSWQEVEVGPERSYLGFATRFDCEGWSIRLYLGGVLLNDFPLDSLDEAADFDRQVMPLDGRILQYIPVLGVRHPSESVTVPEHPFLLFVTEFSDWDDYDENCYEDLDGCLAWNIMHPNDALTVLRRVRARGHWKRLREWVRTRAIAFFWYERTARLMEEGGRLWTCDMTSFLQFSSSTHKRRKLSNV